MWDVLPLGVFQFDHSKNFEILLVHVLCCNDHNVFMMFTWVIHVSYGFVGGVISKKYS
jgi:hypothetical protein